MTDHPTDFRPSPLLVRQLTVEEQALERARVRLVVALRVKRPLGIAAMAEVWQALGVD